MAPLSRSVARILLVVATLGLSAGESLAAKRPAVATPASPAPRPGEAAAAALVGQVVPGRSIALERTAHVNLADLARQEALLRRFGVPPVRALVPSEEMNEMDQEPGAGAVVPAPPQEPLLRFPQQAFVVSPSPTQSFQGLDDIPMVDSSYIVVPPDVAGGVGPTKVMESFNNNYRIRDKVTGATQLTIGTATFWNPVVTNKALLNQLTDPRTTYDPIQGRWIVAMQTVNNPSLILFGVSQTSDPAGSWFLYSVSPGFTSSPRLDYPMLGFNKNWIVVTINAFTAGGAFSRGGTMIANYPQAAAGTLSSVTNVSQAAGSHFCTSPCVTLSATEDTLFLVTHLSSAGATYAVDRITGSVTPTYTNGGTQTRPGGGWVQPSGQQQPQSAPNAGTSSCGATPCPIETQDAQVRSDPVFRLDATSGRQFIYYTQTIGLPAGAMTHTAVQWTKITASVTPAFADGGRIDDPTATSTNGGKWHAFPHIAVNSQGDFLIGYSQFSSAQHPSAGYSYHDHTDGAGTIRDPLVYKAGEDYYHKDFGGGRNRWGDFTTAQVDPSDDQTLWVLQEYAKPRVNTDDGGTGANGSRWSSFWANLTPGVASFTIDASAGANGSISPSGAVAVSPGANQSFTITPNACYHIADVLVDGSSVGAVPTFTFNNVQASHTISASFAIDTHTITASAGANGAIAPSGGTSVNCGANQSYTITPNACYHVADVLVDGGSVGAVTNFTFTNVTTDHTISASFAINTYTITASAGTGGTINPSGSVVVNCGADQPFAITPDAGRHVADVLVDGGSVGAVTTFDFTNVTAAHTIAASFDNDSFTVAVSVVGQGSVAKSPDQPRYAFNQGVSLAATPVAGWGFSGWSGDVVSAANPLPLTITSNVALTATFADTTRPAVQVLAPAPGEALLIGSTATLSWTATDNVAVTAVDLLLSRTGSGGPFDSLAVGIANTGTFGWSVTGPTTTDAFLEVVAHDAASLAGSDLTDSAFTITSNVGVGGSATPTEFALGRIAPHPVLGTAHIRFDMPRSASIRLSVYDMLGREVAVLADGPWESGTHQLDWRDPSASPGLYFVRLLAPGHSFVQRLVRVQ